MSIFASLLAAVVAACVLVFILALQALPIALGIYFGNRLWHKWIGQNDRNSVSSVG